MVAIGSVLHPVLSLHDLNCNLHMCTYAIEIYGTNTTLPSTQVVGIMI